MNNNNNNKTNKNTKRNNRKPTPKRKLNSTKKLSNEKPIIPRAPIREKDDIDKYIDDKIKERERWHRDIKRADKEIRDVKKAEEELPWYEEAGRNVGQLAAKGAHWLFKHLTGFGDYEVQTNSLLAQATDGEMGSAIPIMYNSEVANVIRHREFLGNVKGSTSDFMARTYSINLGLDDTFPWGFANAVNYTTYRIRGMVFEYKSLSSEYTSTPYMGFVAMGTQYNVLEPTFTSKKQLENSEYANSCKPSKNMMHPIECHRDQVSNNHLYVRSGSAPEDADLRLYDLGKMTIATGGQSSNGILGELWVTYEVEFFTPKLASGVGALSNCDHFTGTGAAGGITSFANSSKANGSTLGCTISSGSAQVNFPHHISSGTYLLTAVWNMASQANVAAPTWSAGTGTTLVTQSFGTQATSQTSSYGAVTTTSCYSVCRLKVTKEEAHCYCSTGGTMTSANWDLYICQVPDGMDQVHNDSIIVDDNEALEIQRLERMDYIKQFENFKKKL